MFDFLRDLPLGIIRVVTETFEWMFGSFMTAYDPEAPRRPIWLTILMLPILLPYWIFRGLLFLVAIPFNYFSMDEQRSYRFFKAIPALTAVLGFTIFFAFSWWKQGYVTLNYFQRMKEAMQDQDFKLASVIGGRLIHLSEKDPAIMLQYAFALANSGQREQAEAIINDLAPRDRIVNPDAHRIKALEIASRLSKVSDRALLDDFYWHLTGCGSLADESLLVLWALYYEKVGQFDDAIAKLQIAAKKNPSHLFSMANLALLKNDKRSSDEYLAMAEQVYRGIVEKEPLNRNARLQLSVALVRLSKLDDAEKLLLEGLKNQDVEELRRAVSEFYVLRYDIANKRDHAGFQTQFAYLEKALRSDLSYTPVYDRIIELFSNSASESERTEIEKLLEDLIVEGKNASLAHFSMSSLLLVQGKNEEAALHLRQAMQSDVAMPVVANNLAYILATREPPMLDEAYQLASKAVEASPESHSFRDTLGTILLQQGKYQEAITELEYALKATRNKKAVHQKLATAYQAVGQTSLAEKHAARANAPD